MVGNDENLGSANLYHTAMGPTGTVPAVTYFPIIK